MLQLNSDDYGELNRIKSVTEAQLNSSGGWTFNLFTQYFNYDRWGNRTVSCSPCQPGVTGDVFTIDTATNRITAKNGNGMTYDSAGNQTYDATGNRWFDGENRMHKATQGGTTSHYVYNADGKRVRRIIGSTETWMVYGVDGELVGEYAAAASASSPQKEYGYRSGQMLIAAETSPLKITWLVTDHLGTPRMNIRGTGTDGGSLASVTRHDYLPFGEELIAGIRVNGGNGQHGYEPPPDNVRQKFTGHERDGETGLDFAQARYISSTQGRFTSTDPVYIEPSRLADPQRFNLYSYVRNNPLVFIDPTGMVIDTSKLSKKDLEKWGKIAELANATDEEGRFVNPKLHEVYETLQSDERTFFIENTKLGASTVGKFEITDFNEFDGKSNFTEAVIHLDFKKIESVNSVTQADLVDGFNKFEGLLGGNKKNQRLAEVFGHEGAHGIYALNNISESIKLQELLNSNEYLRNALPIKGRYPLPPDLQQKIADADRGLIPTERYAQQAEKIVNGELRATPRKKK